MSQFMLRLKSAENAETDLVIKLVNNFSFYLFDKQMTLDFALFVLFLILNFSLFISFPK